MVSICKNRLLVGICLTTCLIVGCGGSPDTTAAVTGTVSLDGLALADGTVRFVPLKGTPGQKVNIPVTNGEFAIEADYGPSVGLHRVEIESNDTGGLELDDEDAMNRLKSDGVKRVKVVKVPRWYNDHSILRAEISGTDSNELSFELTTKRTRR